MERNNRLADVLAGPNALPDVLRKQLYPGEEAFFRKNPSVSGMAAEDGRVILNPWAPAEVNQNSVYANEVARLYMRGMLPGYEQVRPNFSLTPDQLNKLQGTTYSSAPLQDQRETIAARIFSGDPSAGTPTGDQKAFVDTLRARLQSQR